MNDPLPSGAVIGILGGGQLGRMLSVAASRLGFRTHVYEPAANPPAAHVADRLTTAGEALCGDALWSNADGRALAALIEELRGAAAEVGTQLAPADLPAVLRDALDRVAVRPPWGGRSCVSAPAARSRRGGWCRSAGR